MNLKSNSLDRSNCRFNAGTTMGHKNREAMAHGGAVRVWCYGAG